MNIREFQHCTSTGTVDGVEIKDHSANKRVIALFLVDSYINT